MAAPKALLVAAAAVVALVASILIDVNVNRVYYIEVDDAGTWRTVGSHGEPQRGRYAYSEPVGAYGTIVVDANDTVDLRLRVENDYPWDARDRYVVHVNGVAVTEGDITIPARGTGIATFSLEADRLLGQARGPQGEKTPGDVYVSLYIDVDGRPIYASFPLREAS